MFWYKSFIYAAVILVEMNRVEESMALVNSITKDFPPIALWERIKLLEIKGSSYEKLNNPALANKYYSDVIDLTDKYPGANYNIETQSAYLRIATFYASGGNVKKGPPGSGKSPDWFHKL